MKKRFLRTCSPDGLTAEERLFRDGMRYTKIKLYVWALVLVIGGCLVVMGWYFADDIEKVILALRLRIVGSLVALLAFAGIALYNSGLRCLEKAELLYNTRQTYELIQKSVPENTSQATTANEKA